MGVLVTREDFIQRMLNTSLEFPSLTSFIHIGLDFLQRILPESRNVGSPSSCSAQFSDMGLFDYLFLFFPAAGCKILCASWCVFMHLSVTVSCQHTAPLPLCTM